MQNKKKGDFLYRIFGNPGAVISVLAAVVLIGGCIASLIFAWTESYEVHERYSRYSGSYKEREFDFENFVSILIGGCAASWASGFALMTIGDTVLNVKRISDKLCTGNEFVNESAFSQLAKANARKPEAAPAATETSVKEEKTKSWNAPAAGGKDVAEQIKELARFYQNGDLTEEEFARKKADLLKKL